MKQGICFIACHPTVAILEYQPAQQHFEEVSSIIPVFAESAAAPSFVLWRLRLSTHTLHHQPPPEMGQWLNGEICTLISVSRVIRCHIVP